MLKLREKVDEVTFVVTDIDKMSLEDTDNEELMIWKTIEDAIKKRLRSGGKAEEEETIRIGEKLWKIEEDSDAEDKDFKWDEKREEKTKIVGSNAKTGMRI